MQTRSRENGSSSCNGKFRKGKVGQYQKAVACLTQIGLIFLLSCSSVKVTKFPEKLSSQFKNICFSGEGYGRISFLSGRHLFDYESMTNSKKEEWALAFHYPVIGEKLIKLDFSRALEGPFYSDFSDRLLIEIQDEKLSKNYREVLREFFHRLALVIKTHEDFRKGNKSFWQCFGGNCSYHDLKMSWELKRGKLFLQLPLSNDYIFHLVAFSKDKYFDRMRIFVQKEKNIGIKRNPLEVMLFLNHCYQKPGSN